MTPLCFFFSQSAKINAIAYTNVLELSSSGSLLYYVLGRMFFKKTRRPKNGLPIIFTIIPYLTFDSPDLNPMDYYGIGESFSNRLSHNIFPALRAAFVDAKVKNLKALFITSCSRFLSAYGSCYCRSCWIHWMMSPFMYVKYETLICSKYSFSFVYLFLAKHQFVLK